MCLQRFCTALRIAAERAVEWRGQSFSTSKASPKSAPPNAPHPIYSLSTEE
jgi:hypothetical protein